MAIYIQGCGSAIIIYSRYDTNPNPDPAVASCSWDTDFLRLWRHFYRKFCEIVFILFTFCKHFTLK
jgi:hypothetical protein